MRAHILTPRPRAFAVAIVATLSLAACGGGGDDDSSAATTPDATTPSSDDQTAQAAPGQSPFTAVIECLQGQGLDVEEPDFGGGGGPPGRGSIPPDFSVPEGGFPDGSLPDGQFPRGTPPEGGFPGGSVPEGGIPDGSRPDGGPGAGGGFPGGGDPTFLANALGLDANDPDVAAAIETCSAQFGG